MYSSSIFAYKEYRWCAPTALQARWTPENPVSAIFCRYIVLASFLRTHSKTTTFAPYSNTGSHQCSTSTAHPGKTSGTVNPFPLPEVNGDRAARFPFTVWVRGWMSRPTRVLKDKKSKVDNFGFQVFYAVGGRLHLHHPVWSQLCKGVWAAAQSFSGDKGRIRSPYVGIGMGQMSASMLPG